MAVKDFDWLGSKFGTATENLRAKAGTKVEQTIAEWVRERIDIAQSVLDEPKGSNPSRNSNATGSLRASIRPKDLITNGEEVLVEVIAEDYWDRLNKGVNGTAKSWGSPYSFDSMGLNDEFRNRIKTWTRDRGIVPREPEMSQDDLAYVIAKSVRKKGVMPVPFMDEGFSEEAIKDLADRLGKTVKRIFE